MDVINDIASALLIVSILAVFTSLVVMRIKHFGEDERESDAKRYQRLMIWLGIPAALIVVSLLWLVTKSMRVRIDWNSRITAARARSPEDTSSAITGQWSRHRTNEKSMRNSRPRKERGVNSLSRRTYRCPS